MSNANISKEIIVMQYKNKDLLRLIPRIDFGSSIAELDTLLETARVETSAFSDLLSDKVDLIPGTKGSGKSALYRIFVEFLPDLLLQHKKVVIAHGVNHQGDSVFHAFNDNFEKLDEDDNLPRYAETIRKDLETILEKANLNVWLMIDRLDEIFPRRSDLERRALRGLLRTMRIFTSDQIRIKAFLRDDILNEVVRCGEGFTALTHLTARQADTLRWSEDQILTMIAKRLFSSKDLCDFLKVETDRLNASLTYRQDAFYKVFPPTVHKGSNQSKTLRWIYHHTADGNNVVTPRDVIDLLTKAKQYQHNKLQSEPSGESQFIIGQQSIQYGLSELSNRKRTTFLEAEFPHLWKHMEK